MTDLVRNSVTKDPVEGRQVGAAHDFNAIRIYGDLHPPLGTGQCVPKRLLGESARCMGEDLGPHGRRIEGVRTTFPRSR